MEDEGFMNDICDGDEELLQVARELLSKHKAPGTIQAYRQVQKDFKNFCEQNKGLSYHLMGSKEVGRFIIKCKQDNKAVAYWGKLRAALEDLEKQRNVQEKDSAFSPAVLVLLEGGKRMAAAKRPVVKKTKPLDSEALKKGLEEFVLPFCPDKIMQIDLVKLRTLFRWTVNRQVLGRYEDFSKLQAKHFSITEDKSAIRVVFPRSKNDQFANGTIKYLPKKMDQVINPYNVTLIYFKRCGFKMDGQDTSFVNCRVKKIKDGTHVPIPDIVVSSDTVTKQAKDLLQELGFTAEGYAETAPKRAGVTEALESGTSIDDLQQIGGWRTNSMPLMYAANNEQHKIELARKMNLS